MGLSFQLLDRLERVAAADTAFGRPIEAEGHTLVPVARVAYGFGGGYGTDRGERGGGGGGGTRVTPLGVVDVSSEGSRFVSAGARRRRLALLALVGALLGYLLGRRS